MPLINEPDRREHREHHSRPVSSSAVALVFALAYTAVVITIVTACLLAGVFK